MTDKSQERGKSLVLLFSKRKIYMYVSLKFYLYEILIHSVIHLLIKMFFYIRSQFHIQVEREPSLLEISFTRHCAMLFASLRMWNRQSSVYW